MSLKLAVERVASLRPLVVAGVLAASAVTGSGAALASVPTAATYMALGDNVIEIPDADAEMLRANAEADAPVIGLQVAALKRIAAIDLSSLPGDEAVATVREMAREALATSGQ